MLYTFTQFQKNITETQEWLKKELANIQTGRANSAFLDGLFIESYGSNVPVTQVANIGNEDARTLRIVPWEAKNAKAIFRAVEELNLGLSLSIDDKGVRVVFPELTTETREKYVKLVKNKLEDARVSLRQERDEVWKDIQKLEKDGDMSEDEKKRAKDEMEKLTKEANEALDALAERREKEIRG